MPRALLVSHWCGPASYQVAAWEIRKCAAPKAPSACLLPCSSHIVTCCHIMQCSSGLRPSSPCRHMKEMYIPPLSSVRIQYSQLLLPLIYPSFFLRLSSPYVLHSLFSSSVSSQTCNNVTCCSRVSLGCVALQATNIGQNRTEGAPLHAGNSGSAVV